MKSNGLKTRPCCTPTLISNSSLHEPFTIILFFAPLYIVNNNNNPFRQTYHMHSPPEYFTWYSIKCLFKVNENKIKVFTLFYLIHSWQRVPNPPILWRPPILSTLPFFKFSPTTSLLPPTPTPTAYSVILFLWLNGWLCHTWCATLIDDIMDVHMSSLRILMCVLCSTRQVLLCALGYQPSFKNTTPLFLDMAPLKSIKCPSSSFLGNSPYILVFHEPPPKNWISQWAPTIFHT